MAILPGGAGFDLDLRHIDAGRTIALAALARDTQVERFLDFRARQTVTPQLAGKGQPQCIGAAARYMHFVLRDAVARAHRTGIELAAVAIVIAHLDCLGEATGVVPARARFAFGAGQWLARDVPGRPIQSRGQRHLAVFRAEAEIAYIVHLGGIDDLVRVETIVGIEQVLDVLERLIEPRAVLPRHPFATAQAIAMLARIRAFELAYQR